VERRCTTMLPASRDVMRFFPAHQNLKMAIELMEMNNTKLRANPSINKSANAACFFVPSLNMNITTDHVQHKEDHAQPRSEEQSEIGHLYIFFFFLCFCCTSHGSDCLIPQNVLIEPSVHHEPIRMPRARKTR